MLLAHCNREVFHVQWEVILDDKFINAWKNGILMAFDKTVWWFYPRTVTYSANYIKK